MKYSIQAPKGWTAQPFAEHELRLFAPGTLGVQRATQGSMLGILTYEARRKGEVWYHLSLSLPHRCPTWKEITKAWHEWVGETVCGIQLVVPKRQNVSMHAYCLHILSPLEETVREKLFGFLVET